MHAALRVSMQHVSMQHMLFCLPHCRLYLSPAPTTARLPLHCRSQLSHQRHQKNPSFPSLQFLSAIVSLSARTVFKLSPAPSLPLTVPFQETQKHGEIEQTPWRFICAREVVSLHLLGAHIHHCLYGCALASPPVLACLPLSSFSPLVFPSLSRRSGKGESEKRVREGKNDRKRV